MSGAIKLIPHRAKRFDNQEMVTGIYWRIEEHYDPRLSNRHFIKSLKNGVDYEVIEDTLEFFTEYLDINNLPIFIGDKMGFWDEVDDFGQPVEQTGIITYDEESNSVFLAVDAHELNNGNGDIIELMDLMETYGGYIV